jgi:hypothetical protein
MGEVPKEGVGKGGWVHEKNRLKSDRYHCNQDRERNPMVEVPNKGVNGTTILFFFFYSYGVILRFEYFCSFRMPKFLTVKNV